MQNYKWSSLYMENYEEKMGLTWLYGYTYDNRIFYFSIELNSYMLNKNPCGCRKKFNVQYNSFCFISSNFRPNLHLNIIIITPISKKKFACDGLFRGAPPPEPPRLASQFIHRLPLLKWHHNHMIKIKQKFFYKIPFSPFHFYVWLCKNID
jgi:hypothetical protein